MYDLNKINPMYQFSLMVRIDLQITALCSPGHNYPLTFPSPSHTECCWSPLENLMWSFTTPCTDNVIVLLSHAWIFSCDAAGTKKSHLNTRGVQKCAFFVFPRLQSSIFVLFLIIWLNVCDAWRKGSDSPLTFSTTPEDLLKVEGR